MTTQDGLVPSKGGGEGWEGSVWSPARRDELLRATCQADPPRRFALCEELCDERGEAATTRVFTVFAWGLAYADGAVLSGGRITAGSFRSAERALDLFGRDRALHLYWLDPKPSERPAGD